MRYYDITINPINNGKQIRYTTSSLGFVPNTSALRVDLDIFQQMYHQAGLNSYVRIYGINYKDIAEFTNLNPILPLNNANNFATITVRAGMSKGLPLAKPAQQGILVTGFIGQAFANWVGNEITLDLIIIPRIGSPSSPVNLPFVWNQGQTLEAAVRQCLQVGYQGTPILGNYSPDLVYPENQPAQYYDLENLATYVYNTSKQIKPQNDYQGATITYTADGFLLSDGTTKPAAKKIEYTDFIGNVTWLDVGTIQAKLVMRGDLTINDRVQFPATFPQTNLVNSFSQFRNKVSQPGEFTINQIRHVGSSRQPSADSWVTIINCLVELPQ
jgi:hypothetical protein